MNKWLLVFLISTAFAQQQPVNVGTGANTGSGDPLRTAFQKLNANDAQLYSMFGLGSSLQSSGVVSAADIQGLFGGSLRTFPGVVESLDYCAFVVNTTADAVPCLQQAANAASTTSSRILHVSGGTYYIRTRWNCPANGVVIQGDGWNLTQAGVGTWLHVVTSQFQSGGAQQGNHPFQCGSSAAVNLFEVRDVAFTEDQPSDSNGWTPTAYAQGSMWIFANGSFVPRFVHDYFAGVNYAINFHSVQGYYLEGNSFQIYTTGVQVDHNGDWAHVINNSWQDTFCNTTNCPNITAYIQANAIGFQSNRNDNPSFIDNEGFGLFSLLQLGTDSTGVTTNAKVTHMDCDKCYHTVNITAAGTSAQLDQLQGHTFNFVGNAALRGGTIVSESAGTATLQISNLRAQNTGDSAIVLGGAGDVVTLTGSYIFSWGQNSAANGTCDATVHAINVGAANSNSVIGSRVAFSAGGCSTLTYTSSNTVAFSNALFSGWTPSLLLGGGNTGMTATQVGEYQVSDHDVDIQFVISVSALGSSAGAVTISGLPITTSTSGNWGAAGLGGCAQASGLSSMTGPIVIYAAANSSTLQLFQMGSTGLSALTDANLSNSTTLRCRFSVFQ